jgi:HK97 gp10 family phage protein
MNAETQAELNSTIKRVRGLYPAVQRGVKQDLNEAAQVLVSAVKGRTPISGAAHRSGGKIVQPGNLQRSIRRLPLRRTRNAAIVGPNLGRTPDGFYAAFVEKGTKFQKAQRFIEQAANAAGPAAQSIAIKLIIRRVNDYEAANFK